jgi:glutathione S-transferase
LVRGDTRDTLQRLGMLRIYGNLLSRAYRCLWLCREIGLEVQHVPVDLRTQSKTDPYLALNPAGKVPTLVDGDLVVTESMAINLYLAKKHGGQLAPRNLVEEALTLQWSFWVVAECEAAAVAILHYRRPPANVRIHDEDLARSQATLARVLVVLDAALGTRPYLLGERFTVADLNVSSVLSSAKFGGYDFANVPRVKDWLGRNFARPAQRALLEDVRRDAAKAAG